MWSYSFTVFLSAFQLLPTAPFHILALGGSQLEAGLVPRLPDLRVGDLGADHRRDRRSLRQAPRADRREPGDHGVLAALRDRAVLSDHPRRWCWCTACSGRACCRARARTSLDIVPKSRRAEGLGYSGFASVLGVAVAPWIGLWIFDHGGWRLLCFEAAGAQPDHGGHRVAPAARQAPCGADAVAASGGPDRVARS